MSVKNKKSKSASRHNAAAQALFHRAGNVGVAVEFDFRPKRVRPKKGNGSYRRNKRVEY